MEDLVNQSCSMFVHFSSLNALITLLEVLCGH